MEIPVRESGLEKIISAVQKGYAAGQSDYSLEPVTLEDQSGSPIGRIGDGDCVIFCCRRGEREIQLTEAFTQPEFDRFPRRMLQDLTFVILTLYHEKFKGLPVAFSPVQIRQTLAEVVSQAGIHQTHISESEKFAHVTFFLNGGNNRPFPGEDDICIPSPKGIAYEKVPELSLARVSTAVIQELRKGTRLVITNFANGDVIGHTTSREAKLLCARHLDQHLHRVVDQALAEEYAVLITADHGNLEVLFNEDGTPHISHTSNPVPVILLDPLNPQPATLAGGSLNDIAPTILQILGIQPPAEMDGKSLAGRREFSKDRKVLLVILDGWGTNPESENNPISLASAPFWYSLLANNPHTLLEASGESVGLLPDKTGNSEAGHLNIGAGRIVPQDDLRLDAAMNDGSFYSNEIILQTIQKAHKNGKKLHLLALLTEKSSHGSIDYPLAILKMAKTCDFTDVYLHMILDGRSTAPCSAPALLEKLQMKMEEIGAGQIVSGMGRGIALDRDGNYHKTRMAYEALVEGNRKRVRYP